MNSQKGSGLIIGILIGVIAMLALYAAYDFGRKSTGNLTQNSSNQATNLSTNTSDSSPSAKLENYSSPTPEPTKDWKTYSNKKYAFSVKYPLYLRTEESSSYYFTVNFKTPVNSASEPLPTFYISIISDDFTAKDPAAYNFLTSDWIDTFFSMETGDTKSLTDELIIKKLPNQIVSGQDGLVMEVTSSNDNVRQRRIYLKKNGYVYMIATFYQQPEELDNFQNFLSNFKFSK